MKRVRTPPIIAAFYVIILCTLPSSINALGPDTWAVIVSSSRFWLNYRHTTNALGIYQSMKRLGIPDSNIILMLADDSAHDARNSLPGQILASSAGPDWHPVNEVELDYRGRETRVKTVLEVLTGRHPSGVPPSKRLQSGANSSVLLYFTGHGGDGFLKFHDQDELLEADLAAAVAQMHASKRYGRLLIMLDTCQAATMYRSVKVPNWIGVASSKLGQSSYALTSDGFIGTHLVDEFSYFLAQYLSDFQCGQDATLDSLLDYIRSQPLSSVVDYTKPAGDDSLGTGYVGRVSDFFCGVY